MINLTGTQIAGIITALLTLFVGGLFLVLRTGTNSYTEINDLEQMGNGMIIAFQNLNYIYPVGPIAPAVLINGGKVPAGMVSGGNLVTRWGTPILPVGIGQGYTVPLTATPQSTCIDILSDAGLAPYLSSIIVSGATARVPPVPATTAAIDCAGTTNTVTLTYTGHP
jgi:hypothetical protein